MKIQCSLSQLVVIFSCFVEFYIRDLSMKYSHCVKMLKSALKKQNLVNSCDERRVTFCKTVQIYSNSLKPDEALTNFESSPDVKRIPSQSSPIKRVTFESLFNKYTEPELFDFTSNEDDPSHFLVHKVIYDDDHLNLSDISDNSEDLKVAEEEEQDSDSENEEFIVHKVTLQSEEVSGETCEGESENPIDQGPNEDKEVVCELSVQNIEQHNKLTDGQLLLELETSDAPVIMASLENSDIILSPPLQELGVSRLICAQPDDWFWNLNISPLNSVQETDSESNLSSEDTMIMMTSEECAKNEQRIQESLQKFESLKKQNATSQEPKSESVPEEPTSIETPSLEIESSDSLKNIADTSPSNGESELTKAQSQLKCIKLDDSEVQPVDLEPSLQENTDYSKRCDTVCGATTLEGLSGHVSSSSSHRGRLNSWDKDLTAVEIPKDVREWKICIHKDSARKLSNTDDKNPCILTSSEVDLNTVIQSKFDEVQSTEENSTIASEHCVDELEHFVDQCTERVERIRKRYSINENMLWTPRRGIRPRFGSSAEILQHGPNGNHLLSYSTNGNSNNHYSWPYYLSADQQEEIHLQKPKSGEFFTNFFDDLSHTNLPQFDSSHCGQTPMERLRDMVKDNGTMHVPASTELASSLPPFHERGTPEGASPPRLSSESLCDSEKPEFSESIVYYSLEV